VIAAEIAEKMFRTPLPVDVMTATHTRAINATRSAYSRRSWPELSRRRARNRPMKFMCVLSSIRSNREVAGRARHAKPGPQSCSENDHPLRSGRRRRQRRRNRREDVPHAAAGRGDHRDAHERDQRNEECIFQKVLT
jgi:hypothetical protein